MSDPLQVLDQIEQRHTDRQIMWLIAAGLIVVVVVWVVIR